MPARKGAPLAGSRGPYPDLDPIDRRAQSATDVLTQVWRVIAHAGRPGGRRDQDGERPVADRCSPDVLPEVFRECGANRLQGAVRLPGALPEPLKQSMTFPEQVTDGGWFFAFQARLPLVN